MITCHDQRHIDAVVVFNDLGDQRCPLCDAVKLCLRQSTELVEKQKKINDMDYRINHAEPNRT